MSGAPAEVGSTANNYQILARLAVGGMAEIFLARGVSAAGVERYCVLKRILRNRATDLHFVRMFLDEARLAAQLNHPNVAQVFDIGKLADSYFFTMEFVHGETVRAILQRARSLRRELPLGSILTVVAGAAAGLHHAHDRLGLDGRPLGIVHRDVSPSNLMVSFEGGVKLVDFGVAKAADRMSETRSGTVKGKISYLSPEQCRGAPVDRRSDLFALGIVMWEMLTLERLYRRASDFENMSAIVNEPTPPPSSRRRSVPPELDAITMRLLAKDPDARYQTADDVVEAIEQAAAGTGAMLSSSTLGRLLREMFGQRPEPWLEMDPHDAPEGVTVTSEPVPAELSSVAADPLDLELAGVPDLSVQELSSSASRPMTAGDGVPRPVAAVASARQRLTAPMRTGRTQDQDASAPAEAPPLPPPPAALPSSAPAALAPPQPGELPLPAPPATVPEVLPNRTHPVSSPRMAAQVPPGAGELRRSGPQLPMVVPGSGGHAAPASGGHAVPSSEVHAVRASGAQAAADVEADDRPTRGWTMIAVILAAMVIGSLTVLLVMKSGNRASGPDTSLVRSPPAEPPDAAIAPVGPIVTPLGAEDAAPPEPPTPLPPPDAQVAVAVVDAAAEVPAAPDAAPTPPAPPPEPARSPLERAMDDRRYSDAVAICTKRVNADTAGSCTLAACHAKLEARARAWLPRASAAERARLIRLCRGLGIDPTPPRRPPPKPDAGVDDKCERNPMACQH